MTFRELLQAAFIERACRNPRYSLRAFARRLAVDHATLSQWLRGKRHLTIRAVEQVGWRLGFAPRQLRQYFDINTADVKSRRILELVTRDHFVPDTRWIARELGMSVDEANITLQRLLRRGLLQMDVDRRWRTT